MQSKTTNRSWAAPVRNLLRSSGAVWSEATGRLLTGSSWALVGALCSQGARLVAFIFAARLLGKENFGALGMVQNTVATAGIFAGLGIGLTATKHVAQYRRGRPEEAGRIVGFSQSMALVSGLAFYVLLWATAPALCSGVLNAPELSDELAVAAPLVFLNTVVGAQTGILAGLEAFRSIATASAIQGMLTLPAVVAGAQAYGLRGAVIGLVASTAAGCGVLHVLIRSQCKQQSIPISLRVSSEDWRLAGGFSLPALLSGAMSIPVQWVAAAILANQPGGYGELGAYNAANQWRLTIVFLPTILERASLPVLTELRSRGDSADYRNTLRTHLMLATGAAGIIAIPLMILSPFIMRLYGPEFVSNWSVLTLLAGAAVLASAVSAVGTVLVSRGEMWLALLFNSLWAIVLVSASLVLVPMSLAVGLACAHLGAYALHALTVGSYALATLSKKEESYVSAAGCLE